MPSPETPTGHPPDIALDAIDVVSNIRRTFRAEAMAQLEDSVRRRGILQPILLRPAGDRYELVAGERRYRAAKAVGLTTVPAMVRELSDDEFIEAQILENLQRENIEPLDEAHGYQAAIDRGLFTATELAARVGVSESHIRKRMRLLRLADRLQAELAAGELLVSQAMLICRLDNERDQIELGQAVLARTRQGAPMMSSELMRRLDGYLRELRLAPFDVRAEGLTAAPPCGQCPKRTQASPLLFDDLERAKRDRCTDGACYVEKSRAAARVKVKAFKANGGKVLTKTEANWATGRQAPPGFVRADARAYDASGTAAEIAGDNAEIVVAIDPGTGAAVDLVEERAFNAGRKKLRAAAAKASPAATKEEARQKREREAREKDIAFRRSLVAEIANTSGSHLNDDVLRWLITDHWDYLTNTDRQEIVEMLAPGKEPGAIDLPALLAPASRLQKLLLTVLAMSQHRHYEKFGSDRDLFVALFPDKELATRRRSFGADLARSTRRAEALNKRMSRKATKAKVAGKVAA